MIEKTKEQNLQLAIQMEGDGEAFFLKAASGADDLLAKRIFEELARQKVCILKIVLIYEQIKGGASQGMDHGGSRHGETLIRSFRSLSRKRRRPPKMTSMPWFWS